MNASALQKTLYAALTAHAPLMALVSGVYDQPGPATARPYVTIGDLFVSDWSSGSFTGAEARQTLDVWTAAFGQQTARDILGALTGALATLPAQTASDRIVSARVTGWRLIADPEGDALHGVLDVRLRLHPLGV